MWLSSSCFPDVPRATLALSNSQLLDLNIRPLRPSETAIPSNDLQERLTDYDLDLPVIVDEGSLLASLCMAFEAPTACFFSSGRLVECLHWGFSGADLKEKLDGLVARTAVPWSAGSDRLWHQPAPTYTPLPTSTDGHTSSELKPPLLIAFLGPNCPYCHGMIPSLLRVAKSFPVFLVVPGELQPDDDLLMLQAEQLTIVPDPNWIVADAYYLSSVPTFFLLDQEGEIQWLHEGGIEDLGHVCETAAQRFR